MTDMMLTGRTLSAAEGEAAGLSQYLAPQGGGLTLASELAAKVAGNTPLTNYAVIHALPRIADMSQDHGLLLEAAISAVVQSAPEAKARLQAFLEKRAPKVPLSR
jgi:enoyl-CoA hydratase/carnithine racemase